MTSKLQGWFEPALFYLKTFAGIVCFATVTPASAQLVTIADARSQPVGSTVTINGVVTSGAEFGTIRYMQDGTGGIALFSTSLAAVVRGDNVTVTGVTVQYQNLLELQPVNSFTVNSQANPLPVPVVVTPAGLDENVESQLVRVNDAVFLSSGTFQGNTSYNFVSGGDTGVVYVRGSNPLVGQTIPSSGVDIIGICSQFAALYQLLPRDLNDLVPSSAISIVEAPVPSNITTGGMDVNWTTDVNGTSFLEYGHTPALELGTLTATGNGPAFGVTISGGSPSDLYYCRAVAVLGQDTAKSAVRIFITASGSTGTCKTYFNRPVDQNWAIPSGNVAHYIPGAFDDTIKAYIDRSVQSLDIAIYNFDVNSTGNIIQAINDAWNRGVQVRIVADGGNSNTALTALNPAIPVLFSPTSPASYYGIMHNKFMILDAASANPNLAVVLTGSTNWTLDQLNNDRNNMVFIQDKSLAKVYTMEFEEMWGGSGPNPVPANARFGPDKTDNTPHELLVGGKRVECFFSPSDNTNFQISRTIRTADQNLYFATLVFTRFDLAYEIEDRVSQYGVFAGGIMDDSTNGGGTSFLIMQSVMNNNLLLFDHSTQPGILHHKYLIVDTDFPNSGTDPLVLTGSHNWSSTANLRNDENTVIIHDPLVANQFFQEFHNMFNGNGGALGAATVEGQEQLVVYPNPSHGQLQVLFPADLKGAVKCRLMNTSGQLVWSQQWVANGSAQRIPLDDLRLAPGVYLFQVTGNQSTHQVKWIVR